MAAQHRYALNQGNMVGRDFGASSGFGTLALHASYRVQRDMKVTVGVERPLPWTKPMPRRLTALAMPVSGFRATPG